MKELDFIKIIQNEIGNEYIGDDCAYLEELGIVITQDSLVEGIHFRRDWYRPEELGYKSVAVNISDILASGAKPAYITIAISIPNDIDSNFVKEFYNGAKEALFGAKIVGGDITGSKSGIMISITAIGKTLSRNISSRKNAKVGYSVVISGNCGSSSVGLKELLNNGADKRLIYSHIHPNLQPDFSDYIATHCTDDYAMMDTSDGLADALFKIAEASDVKIITEYKNIPHEINIQREDVLFGGEDYKLLAVIPEEIAERCGGYIIGKVVPYDGIRLQIDEYKYEKYDDLCAYDHFGR